MGAPRMVKQQRQIFANARRRALVREVGRMLWHVAVVAVPFSVAGCIVLQVVR